ncbi:NAD-dependent epimerase/dehydratase family protein [Acidovorax sp.]|uniref:NAD-dependent epimerase/dehydratase family protein n=1 Tax=Acidovorax sp. TaxID=1872122 RepID=UPI002ACDDF18|nr:NAD-dependent epimerase/dehydratase family protein [Acidovorax sp.]MDZ7861830.1 NAD-dependent epimerase/dehydratase family protein [Acidovorax sp.]
MTPFTVLGASGYIGSRLVAHLQGQGHTVLAPARDNAGLFSQPLGHVLYCVGLTADFRSRPFDTVEAHVGLLAEVLRRAQFDSLLYLSSTRVYMGAASTDEEAPLSVVPGDPSYLYNLSKLAGESLCHASGRSGVRVARLSNVVGPGMDAQAGNLVADLVHQAQQGAMLLRSHPESAKDYIHIDDVVHWLPRIALGGRSVTYNVASGRQTTHGQWLQWLSEHYASSFEVQEGAPLQRFAPISVARLQAEFGVMARPVWGDGRWRWPVQTQTAGRYP